MRVRLEKIEELPDAKHPNIIPVGHVVEGDFIEPPLVGKCFYLDNPIINGEINPNNYCYWHTSTVAEIINDLHVFKTKNSIYKWSEIPATENKAEEKKDIFPNVKDITDMVTELKLLRELVKIQERVINNNFIDNTDAYLSGIKMVELKNKLKEFEK